MAAAKMENKEGIDFLSNILFGKDATRSLEACRSKLRKKSYLVVY